MPRVPRCETFGQLSTSALRAPPNSGCYASFMEVEMDKTVDVTIPVEPEAAALVDARNREAVGRLVSRMLRPRAGPSPLAEAIAESPN